MTGVTGIGKGIVIHTETFEPSLKTLHRSVCWKLPPTIERQGASRTGILTWLADQKDPTADEPLDL